MACLAEDGKLGMRILGVVIEVSSCKPNGVVMIVDLPKTLFTLFGTTLLASPSSLLLA
jgi:hypothetical protein